MMKTKALATLLLVNLLGAPLAWAVADRVHDFTLRSPNSLGGEVAANAGVNYESGVMDPGSSSVPGIPGSIKEASLVGLVKRPVGEPFWYESLVETPATQSVDLTAYQYIGFFIRVDSTTTDGQSASVPIIIKSGTGAGLQSKLYAEDYISGGLSTDWRWVEIPIADYAGDANQSVATAIQVAVMSNEGGWHDTGWNVDFWIDDIYLMVDDAFPVTPPTTPADDFALVHDFTLRSPNSLSGEVAASEGTLYVTEMDPGSSSVPGIPGGLKGSSLVGSMERSGVDPFWYESLVVDPNTESFNLDAYQYIGFFMRVGSTTTDGQSASVPIIIKSGTGAGAQSILYAEDYVPGGLSTDWRWVEIPIEDYTGATGTAIKSAATAIQVAALSNYSGSFQPTGWNVDFWIDDIYLMVNDDFPLAAFEDDFESYTTGSVNDNTNESWFQIAGPSGAPTTIFDPNVEITDTNPISETKSLSIAATVSAQDGISFWFIGARASVSVDLSAASVEEIIFEAKFRTRVLDSGNNVVSDDFPVEFSLQDTNCNGADDCANDPWPGARRFLVWGKSDASVRTLKKSLAQGEIGIDNGYKGDIDLNSSGFQLVIVTSSDLTDLPVPAEGGPYTVEVYVDDVSLYIDDQQATPAASVDILSFDSGVPQLSEPVQESDRVNLIEFTADGQPAGTVLPGARYHKENEKVRVAWQAPELATNNSWWIRVYADNSGNANNPDVHGLAHPDFAGVSLPLKYSASAGQYGVTTGSGVRRLGSTDPGLSDYAWNFEFRSVLNKDALSGSEVGRLKTETALAQQSATTGTVAASGGERAFWLGLDVPSLVFNGNYGTTLVVELVSGRSFTAIDTYQVDKVGQAEGVKNILLQGNQTTEPFSVTLLALDAEGLVVGDYNGQANVEWKKLDDTLLESQAAVSFTNGEAEVWFASTVAGTLAAGDVTELTVTSTADALINTSATIRVVDGSGAADELSFIDRLRSPTGLVASDTDFENHHLYTNALAAFMYMHAGRYADAKIIFDRINPQQHANGTFPNSFTRSGAVLDDATFNGNQSWYLMALTYFAASPFYADESADYKDNFNSVMVALADYLVARQQSLDSNGDPDDDGAIPFDDSDTVPAIISTEHQTEAYAALRNAHNLDDLDSAQGYNYLTAANLVRDFTMRELYVDPYFQTGYNDSTISTDAQTFTNLAFGPTVGATNITGALGYVYDNMQRTGTVNNAAYSGTVWFEGDTGIWLEGFAQLGAAYKIIANNTTRADAILGAMDPMQDPSGGFQTFSDGYMAAVGDDPDETLPGVPAAAWRYFHLVEFNPYDAVP